MLAYILWHRPYPNVDPSAYESALADFHRRLGETACPGFQGSIIYRIGETPWLGNRPGYEDWILVDAAWALDPLNQAAVLGPMEAVHGKVASLMEVGLGGLYDLLSGEPGPISPSRVLWLTRPRGIQYQDVLKGLADQASGRVTVWRRRMVLGPGTEFALVGNASLEIPLPDGWQALGVDRTCLWPETEGTKPG